MDFKHYLVINSKILLNHFITQLISCAIGLFTFSNIIEFGWGKILAFVFYTGFYIINMYSKAYKIAEKDTKVYSEHKPYILKGVVMCIFTVIISVITLLLYLYGDSVRLENGMCYLVLLNIFRFWNFNLSPMFNLKAGIGFVWYALIFLLPLASVFGGYLAGMRRYELGYKFFSKLVYKDKK